MSTPSRWETNDVTLQEVYLSSAPKASAPRYIHSVIRGLCDEKMSAPSPARPRARFVLQNQSTLDKQKQMAKKGKRPFSSSPLPAATLPPSTPRCNSENWSDATASRGGMDSINKRVVERPISRDGSPEENLASGHCSAEDTCINIPFSHQNTGKMANYGWGRGMRGGSPPSPVIGYGIHPL